MRLIEKKRTNPEIPIIPMIDILAILLIFFIVSTTFKKTRPVLEIDLPTVSEVPSKSIADVRSVLAVAKDGAITLDEAIIAPEALASALITFKATNPDKNLELEADEEINIGQLFQVWDALTKAGIEIKDVPARIQVPSQ